MTDRESPWMHAFYDDAYGQDQIERIAIFDSVVEFLTSIGCKVQYTCCHDGSDINMDYGIYICGVTYKDEKFAHNACYQVRYELPAELLEKLDAKFADAQATAP